MYSLVLFCNYYNKNKVCDKCFDTKQFTPKHSAKKHQTLKDSARKHPNHFTTNILPQNLRFSTTRKYTSKHHRTRHPATEFLAAKQLILKHSILHVWQNTQPNVPEQIIPPSNVPHHSAKKHSNNNKNPGKGRMTFTEIFVTKCNRIFPWSLHLGQGPPTNSERLAQLSYCFPNVNITSQPCGLV